MNNERVARELLKLAKSLTSGCERKRMALSNDKQREAAAEDASQDAKQAARLLDQLARKKGKIEDVMITIANIMETHDAYDQDDRRMLKEAKKDFAAMSEAVWRLSKFFTYLGA